MLKIYLSFKNRIVFQNSLNGKKMPFFIEKIKFFNNFYIVQGRNFLCANNKIYRFLDLIGDFTVKNKIIYLILHNGKIFKIEKEQQIFLDELENRSTSFYYMEYKKELKIYRNLYNRLFLNNTEIYIENMPGRILAFAVQGDFILCSYESRTMLLSNGNKTILKISDRRRLYLKCGFLNNNMIYGIDDLHNLLICTIDSRKVEYIKLQSHVEIIFQSQIFLKNGGIAELNFKNYAKKIPEFFMQKNLKSDGFCIKNKRNLFFKETFIKNFKNRIKSLFKKNKKLYILTENRLYIYKNMTLYTKYEFYKSIDGIFFEKNELFFYRFNHQSVEIFSIYNAYFFIYLDFQPKIFKFTENKLQCKIKNEFYEIPFKNFSYLNFKTNCCIKKIKNGSVEGPIINIFHAKTFKIILRKDTEKQIFIYQKKKIKNVFNLNGKILFARFFKNRLLIFCEKNFLYEFSVGKNNLFFKSKIRLSHRICDIQISKNKYLAILANGTISSLSMEKKSFIFSEFKKLSFCPVLFYKKIIFGSTGIVMWKNKIIYAHNKIIISFCIAKNNLYTISDDHTLSLISNGRLIKKIVAHYAQPIMMKYSKRLNQILILWNSKILSFFDLNLNFMKNEKIFMREPKNIILSKNNVYICGDQLCKIN